MTDQVQSGKLFGIALIGKGVSLFVTLPLLSTIATIVTIISGVLAGLNYLTILYEKGYFGRVWRRIKKVFKTNK